MSNENTLTLFMSARSPFARRVRLALHRQKRAYQEKMVDVFQNNPELERYNPQGAVPTLVLPDGSALTDSTNILEYLEALSKDPKARQASLLAAGIMQSTVLFFQEKMMHEVPSARWLKEHTDCIQDSFAFIMHAPQELWIQNQQLTQAGWDLAVAIEYLELRMPELERSKHYPQLNSLLSLAQKDSFFASSKPLP